MKYIGWLLKAVIFFVVFAFALNNQAPVEVHFFFGTRWQAPMVLVVLSALALGVFAGIVVMLPLWLAARKQAKGRGGASEEPSPHSTPHTDGPATTTGIRAHGT